MTDDDENIFRAVEVATGLARDEVLARDATWNRVTARHVAAFIARHAMQYSYPRVASLLERDHKTAFSSIERCYNLIRAGDNLVTKHVHIALEELRKIGHAIPDLVDQVHQGTLQMPQRKEDRLPAKVQQARDMAAAKRACQKLNDVWKQQGLPHRARLLPSGEIVSPLSRAHDAPVKRIAKENKRRAVEFAKFNALTTDCGVPPVIASRLMRRPSAVAALKALHQSQGPLTVAQMCEYDAERFWDASGLRESVRALREWKMIDTVGTHKVHAGVNGQPAMLWELTELGQRVGDVLWGFGQ